MVPPPPLLDHPDALTPAVDALRRSPEVAVDTEFHSEGSYHPTCMLLQIKTRDRGPWLIDTTQPDVVAAIRDPLTAAERWIVHGGERDLAILQRLFGRVPDRIDDTQVLAGLVDTGWPRSLSDLLETWLHIHVDKAATLSDWSARPLSDRQRSYAADDVLHLFDLSDRLWAEVNTLSRAEIAAQACRHHRQRALQTAPSPHAWREVFTHARHPEEAAAAQALLEWRDAEARSRNKPPPYLLSDSLLRRLARHRPAHADDLADDRRIPARFIRRYGDAILATIAEATTTRPPPEVCPAHSAAARRIHWLTTLLDADGVRRRYAPDLAVPQATRHAIAATDPASPSGPMLHEWQFALLGDLLDQARSGRIGVRIIHGEPACYVEDPSNP